MKEQQKLWDEKWSSLRKEKGPTLYSELFYKRMKNPKGKTLLELGCGDGKDTFYFLKKGLKVTALDFSKKGIERAKKKCEVFECNFLLQNLSKLELEGNFDYIYANLSLHYFDRKTTENIFEKVHALLKEEGLFFLRCKSVDDLEYGKGLKLEENYFYHKEKKSAFFSKESMREYLKDFEILEVNATSSKHDQLSGELAYSCFIQALAKK